MRLRGRLELLEVEFASLRDNALGDPTARKIPVYLPPGYADSAARYPVIYWLHGFGGTALTETNVSPWAPAVAESLDAVIADGAPEAILVHADGFTRFGGSQYVNSSATGRSEDAVLELVAAIDSRYRTLADRDHRAINGKSSGGYGALYLAMRHPDIFGAAASHSGDLYFEACFLPGFWTAADTVRRAGGLGPFLDDFLRAPKKPPDAIRALATAVALAMAYSPDARAPHGFVLPFDEMTGELRPDVWRTWQSFDPVRMVEQSADGLRSLRDLYVECGSRDQYFGHYGGRILSEKLGQYGVAHDYQEFDDNHDGVHYRYAGSLRRQCAAVAP